MLTVADVAPVSKPYAVQASGTHPFLIVSSGDYTALRNRAASQPWSSWKAEAMNDAVNVTINSADPIEKKSEVLGEIASAAALSFILDTANQTTYKNKIIDMVNYFDAHIYPNLNQSVHASTVPPGGAFFNLVLAVDIIYNTLTTAQLTDIETKLGRAGDWFYNSTSAWKESRLGAAGVWALFSHNRTRIDAIKAEYKSSYIGQFTADGVHIAGPGYANNRFTGNSRRDAKTHFLDVLQYTGEETFYSNSSYIKAQEWMFGYVATPVVQLTGSGELRKEVYTFGDTAPNSNPISTSSGLYRAGRFGTTASQYAGATANHASTPRGNLLLYVLANQTLPSGTKVPSKIFPDGGAWLLESSTSSNALAGALWNIKGTEFHSHKDTNALHLSAYGEHVLRNVGYNGANSSALGYSWNYISNRAVGNNTVLFNYSFSTDTAPPTTNDHSKKVGAGITEGFTGGKLEYANGDSGTALPNGKHIRNFVFVHPQDGKNGYWVLFDEVDAATANDPAHVALHPNSDQNPTVVTANTEYRSTIGPNVKSTNNVQLTTFLATPPDSVAIKSGVMAGWSESFVGKYLYSTYPTDSAGKKNIVTVLFPHDSTHAKATMSRVSGTGYTGASINHGGGTVDYALESSEASEVSHSGFSFQGLAAHYRLDGTALAHYFVRKGSSFTSGSQGFSSNGPVSVWMKDKQGQIINKSGGTREVTYYYSGISSVKVNGSTSSPLASGTGWVKVSVPTGTHAVELVTGGAASTITLSAAADAAVWDGTNADTNYGSGAQLNVKDSSVVGYSRDSFLKFNISSAPSTVNSAKLRLYANSVGTTAGITVRAYRVSDDSWSETGITWNSKPARGTLESTTVVTNAGVYYEFDLTSYVQAEKSAGQSVVSIVLTGVNDENQHVNFSSRDNAANHPQLVIE